MIPILYEEGTTEFTNNGIGKLSDCISCLVYEERNGIFEVEFEYGITGKYYSEIRENRIITVSHDEQKDKQPFIIYARSAEISGKVTFYAHHISYLLSGIIVNPFTATSVADAFNSFTHSNVNTNPFAFWTDNSTGGSLSVKVPTSIRAVMGGSQGSILDVFGGEYKFDEYLVRNYASRGANNGVTIRYGKNLMDLNQKTDAEFLYNAVVAYWSDNDSTVVYTGIVTGTGQTANLVSTLDLTSEFKDQPTVAQLTTKAQQYLDNNQPWIPKENIKVDFVALWQTEEYKNVAPLERVQLCDTVTVYYPELGVEATAKVIKVVWDALLERYDSIELGDARSTFADTILQEATDGIDELLAGVPTTSAVQAAINHATELITGGLGGHIVFLYDANGKPTDMLVMDTEDVATAVHVLRINVNGIGFSSTGVSGNYSSAWTLDGAFVADFITAGYLSANRIQGGTLTLGGNNNGNGVIVMYDSSNNEIGRWDNTGLTLQTSTVTEKFGSITFYQCTAGDTVITKTERSGYGLSLKNSSGNASESVALRYTASGTRNSYSKYVSTGDATYPLLNYDYIGASYETLCSIYYGNHGFEGKCVDVGSKMNFTFETTASYFAYALGGKYATAAYGTRPSYPEILLSTTQFVASTNSHFIIITNSPAGFYYDGKTVQTSGSSSKRYKHDITTDISEELDAHRLYDLKMIQFVFNEDHPLQYYDMAGRTLPGFLAEDVAELYPSATIHNDNGEVESWDERRIIPGMLKLIQEQHEEIEDLKQRLAKLEKLVETLI